MRRETWKMVLACGGLWLSVSPLLAWHHRNYAAPVVVGAAPAGIAYASVPAQIVQPGYTYAPNMAAYAPQMAAYTYAPNVAATPYFMTPAYTPGGCTGSTPMATPSYGCCGGQSTPGANTPSATPRKDKTSARLERIEERLDELLATLQPGAAGKNAVARQAAPRGDADGLAERSRSWKAPATDADGLLARSRAWRQLRAQEAAKGTPERPDEPRRATRLTSAGGK